MLSSGRLGEIEELLTTERPMADQRLLSEDRRLAIVDLLEDRRQLVRDTNNESVEQKEG